MPSNTRVLRIAERIRNEMAELLRRGVADPRLEMVTVTGVEVDRELAFATIYVTAFDALERRQEILRALEGARGFFRTELARRIELRAFPKVRFRWDDSADQGAKIEALLKQLNATPEDSEGVAGEG
jgi:ribosome-binding factor A